MNHGDVLVIGGTSDARAICQLDAADVRYTLSVATPTGERLAAISAGRYAAGVWSGSRWRSGSERSAPAG
ncbi:hypothetical protein ACLFLT_20175 [Klebsiella pneumoniae]